MERAGQSSKCLPVRCSSSLVRIYFANGKMTTDGIYGLVRHPQYAGIFLAILGQLVHWPTIPTLLLSPLIVWLYVRLAKREERRHGEMCS